MMDIWRLLADSGVDLVLTGHDHSYQRWLPLDRNGNPAADGVTQFVVGTGGHAIQRFIRTDSRLVVGADSPPDGYGALRLDLQGTGAAFRFENIQGTIMDSGSVACTGAPPDTTPPTEPTNLMATATSANRVDMTWTAASDDVGVTGHEIEREGQIIGSVGPQTSFADTTVVAETSYDYRVRALDLAGNPSAWSNVATVTTPALSAQLFADGFESGDLSNWTTVSGLTVQQGQVFSGSWAARAAGPGASQALKSLGPSETDVYYRVRFRVASQGSNVNLLKFRTASSSILGVYLSSTGKLSYRNDVAAVSRTSSTTVASGGWHELQVRVQIAGASSAVTTWLDGAVVGALTRSESLGTTPIGVVQLGENATGRTFDVAFDDVEVSRELVVV
jgi:hypothetical protein